MEPWKRATVRNVLDMVTDSTAAPTEPLKRSTLQARKAGAWRSGRTWSSGSAVSGGAGRLGPGTGLALVGLAPPGLLRCNDIVRKSRLRMKNLVDRWYEMETIKRHCLAGSRGMGLPIHSGLVPARESLQPAVSTNISAPLFGGGSGTDDCAGVRLQGFARAHPSGHRGRISRLLAQY